MNLSPFSKVLFLFALLSLSSSMLAASTSGFIAASHSSSKSSRTVGLFQYRHSGNTASSHGAPGSHCPGRTKLTPSLGLFKTSNNSQEDEQEVDIDALKAELMKYLEKRKEAGADDRAKEQVGKVVGGTRGNPLLDFVSAPLAKPRFAMENPPNIFDYGELAQYGFSNLVTPIMKAGGRMAMYDLLGMERPTVVKAKKSFSAAKLEIDRTGEKDPGRYKGLKLGQVLDDAAQAEALQEAQRRTKAGESLRPQIAEMFYEQPYATSSSSTSSQTRKRSRVGELTAEKLDEYARQQGKTVDWARRAKAERLVSDRDENLELDLSQRLYSMSIALLFATAFGKSTPAFFTQTLPGLISSDHSTSSVFQSVLPVVEFLKFPAAALLAASVGSSIVSAVLAGSPEKNRNSLVWLVKGLFGGPLTVRQLQQLPPLTLTQGELDAAISAERQRKNSQGPPSRP